MQAALKAKNLTDYNTIANPKTIYPTQKSIQVTGRKINLILDGSSANTIILSLNK